MDLSKVFDIADHKILISKLKNYVVTGNNLKWFESYLDNCKQFIEYNNKYTSFETINVVFHKVQFLDPYYFWSM